MFAVKGPPCRFPADHGAHTGHRLVQGIRHRKIPLAGRRHDGRRAHLQEIRPGGLGGHRVRQARQQLPDIAVLKVHPLQRIDDPAVLHQDQIGVAAHELGAEDIVHEIAHLVGTQELEVDDAVPRLHPDVDETPAGQVLAHQHTEGRRGLRVLEALLRQADPG